MLTDRLFGERSLEHVSHSLLWIYVIQYLHALQNLASNILRPSER